LPNSEIPVFGGFGSLCSELLILLNHFLYLIIQFQPKPSAIPSDFPSWASWKSREVFLPATFHKAAAFNKSLSIAEALLGDLSTFEDGKMDAPLLLVGLMYREVCRAMEMEPGEDNKSPAQLKNSPFGIQQMQKIERVIEAIILPS
jgi:hypothetical protein